MDKLTIVPIALLCLCLGMIAWEVFRFQRHRTTRNRALSSIALYAAIGMNVVSELLPPQFWTLLIMSSALLLVAAVVLHLSDAKRKSGSEPDKKPGSST